MNREKGERSVKSQSYVPYSHQIYDQGYQGNTINAKDNKAKDQRVQVTLNQVTINKTIGLEGQTEFRQNFKKFDKSSNNDDAQDMINQLKSSNVALGYVKNAGVAQNKERSSQGRVN